MKHVIYILLVGLFFFSSCSYESGVSEAFTKYRLKDGVVTVSVPGWLIGIAANVADLEENEKELLRSIDRVKVIAVEDEQVNSKVNLHDEFYKTISEKKGYEKLLDVNNQDQTVTIFGRMDDSVIEEMVVLVGGDDNAMIFVKGEIKPELLNDYIDLSNKNKAFCFGH